MWLSWGMITRLSGILESLDELAGTVVPAGQPGVAYEVLLPAYLAGRLGTRVGQAVTLATLEYLDSPNQGATFVPRLVGFADVREREFFELLTTVKGIGNRKALRLLAAEPGAIASAIASKDSKSLQKLPEVGKRLAETMIAELSGKVEGFLTRGEALALDAAASGRVELKLPPAAEEAVEALVALGEMRSEAERLVARALERGGGVRSLSADAIVGMVYAGR